MGKIIPMKLPQDETIRGYRDLDGLIEELALASGVCNTLFEFEMTEAKSMGERLGVGDHRRLIDNKTVKQLRFLLRDLDGRIDVLKQNFYEADPEHFSTGPADPAA